MTTTTTRFVGVRMVDGVKTVTTYGFCENAEGKCAQVYSTVQNQRTVSQVFTGKTYKSVRAAMDDCFRLNEAAVFEA